ncbi:MAG: pyridoxine 5'-phosphate synthase [Kiritimatiellaeota bacterium]|nr:pyridoxine 5'-phosphate synthase [Kiritimatiellota bacterium]
MIRLGVNIDHVATLRQARRTVYPRLTDAAALCEQAGAHGITVHLREDRRHIQDADVYALRKTIATRMNLELANTPEIIAVALEVKPDEVCMVPERREELTTEGGLDVAAQRDALAPVVAQMRDAGISVSMFINPDLRQVEACAAIGAPYIELHTGTYADTADAEQARELERLIAAARRARELGLRVNAGHGLNLDNVKAVLAIPGLDTLNIGHSIICHAVFAGLGQAVRDMLDALQLKTENGKR